MTVVGNKGPISITPFQAALILRHHGIAKNAAVTLVAIGMAESNLIANNRGGPNSDGSYDWGIWMHNFKGDPSPDWDNPIVNGAWTKTKFLARGFEPWCTWERPACGGNGSGAYRAHLSVASEAVARAYAADREHVAQTIKALNLSHGESAADEPYSTGVSGVINDAGNAITKLSWSDFIGAITDGKTWIRIGLAIMGGVFIILAVAMFVKEQVSPSVARAIDRAGAAARTIPGVGAA